MKTLRKPLSMLLAVMMIVSMLTIAVPLIVSADDPEGTTPILIARNWVQGDYYNDRYRRFNGGDHNRLFENFKFCRTSGSANPAANGWNDEGIWGETNADLSMTQKSDHNVYKLTGYVPDTRYMTGTWLTDSSLPDDGSVYLDVSDVSGDSPNFWAYTWETVDAVFVPATEPSYYPTTSNYTYGRKAHYEANGKNYILAAEGDTLYVEASEDDLLVPAIKYEAWSSSGSNTYNEDVMVTGWNGSFETLDVPAVVPNDYPDESLRGRIVTTIASYAFKENTNLKTVILPYTITMIGYQSFYHCSNVTHIYIGDYTNYSDLMYIQSYAFYGCNSLREFRYLAAPESELNSEYCGFERAENTSTTICGFHQSPAYDIYLKIHSPGAMYGLTNFKFEALDDNHALIDEEDITWGTWQDGHHMNVTYTCVECGWSEEIEAKVEGTATDHVNCKGTEVTYTASVTFRDRTFTCPDVETAFEPPVSTSASAHEHVVHIDAVEPTPNDTGLTECYQCLDCGRYFADEGCYRETDPVIPTTSAFTNLSIHDIDTDTISLAPGEKIAYIANPYEKDYVDTLYVNESNTYENFTVQYRKYNHSSEDVDGDNLDLYNLRTNSWITLNKVNDHFDPDDFNFGGVEEVFTGQYIIKKREMYYNGYNEPQTAYVIYPLYTLAMYTVGNNDAWTWDITGQYPEVTITFSRYHYKSYSTYEGGEYHKEGNQDLDENYTVTKTAYAILDETVNRNQYCYAYKGYYTTEDDHTFENYYNHPHDLVHVVAVAPSYDAATDTYTNGHMEYWYCSNCGKYYADAECATEITQEQAEEEIFYFVFSSENNDAKLMKYNGADTDIVIPDVVPESYSDETLRGKKIVTIQAYAFKNNNVVRKVVMGDNIEIIGFEAFASCPNLEEVEIGAGLTRLDSYAFTVVPKLTKVTCTTVSGSITVAMFVFNSTQTEASHITVYGYHTGAFRNAYDNSSFAANPAKLIYVGLDDHTDGPVWSWTSDHYAATVTMGCANCDYRETAAAVVTIAEGTYSTVYTAKATIDGVEYTDKFVETVDGHAVTHHDRVAPTYDPDNNTYTDGIKEYWSCACGKLYSTETCETELTQDQLVLPYFTFETINVTFTHDTRDLICVANYNGTDSDIVIPDTVPANYYNEALRGLSIGGIKHSSFAGNNVIRKVEMGNNIQWLGWHAFYNCTSLEEVVIGTGLAKVDSYVFATLPALRSVTCYTTEGDIYVTQYAVSDVPSTLVFYGYHEGAFHNICKHQSWIDRYRYYQYIGVDAHTAPAWNWTADENGATASAVFQCENCDFAETVQADVTSSTEDGKIIYTASVEVGNETYTDTKEVEIPDTPVAELLGQSIILDGAIGVNLFMTLSPAIAASETAYMEFTVPSGNKFTTERIYVKDVQPVIDTSAGSEECYVFTCYVAAKEMASEIKAQIVDTDAASEVYTTSVKDYAEYIITHADESQRYVAAVPLVKDMLNYGAYAKAYFDPETPAEELANASLSEGEKELPAPPMLTGYDVVKSLPGGVTLAGSTVSLKSQISLSLYFSSADTLTFACDMPFTTEYSNGYQIVRIKDIPIAKLGDNILVTVTTSNGTNGTVEYPPMRYCQKALASDDEGLKDVITALHTYYLRAKEYFEDL